MPDVLAPDASAVERREANRRLRRVAVATGVWALLASGRLDSQRRRRLAMLRLHESVAATQALGRALASGRLDPAAWHARFAGWLLAEHRTLTLAILGQPGTTRAEPLILTDPQESDLERGSRLQLGYLDRFRSQVESKAVPLDGRIAVRAGLYARAAWGVAWTVARSDAGREAGVVDPMHPFPHASPGLISTPYARSGSNRGNLLERRVLGDAHHCGDCPELADRGWQPYGTLPPIGATKCGPFCLCHFEYRTIGGTTPTAPGNGPRPRPGLSSTAPRPKPPRFELSDYSRQRGDRPVRVDLNRLAADVMHELSAGMRPASIPVIRAEIAKSGVVHAPRVGLTRQGTATVLDGRHRLQILLDMGLRRITVAVDPAELKGIRARYGAR